MSGKGDKKRRRALDAYGRLQRAAALSAARVEDAVHPFGLSASQFGVLEALEDRGPVHQQELAGVLGRSKAQMTAIIDVLETRTHVRRERHATDRRFITVHLTEQGREVLAVAAPARADAIVTLMRELSGDQRVRLARLCRRLLRVLDPDAPQSADDASDDAADEVREEVSDDSADDASDDRSSSDAPSSHSPS